jgi:signal transduction histidine kinase
MSLIFELTQQYSTAMNLRRQLILLLLLPLTALVSWADGIPGFTRDHPLIIGLDLDYAPMEYVDADGMPHGLDVDFTQELMSRMNVHYTYQPNTWQNIKDDIIEGKVDLGMMVYSPYRQNILFYSRAVMRLYYQVVFRKDAKGHYDLRNLKGKDVAYMESRPVTDTLTQAGAKLHVVTDLHKALIDLNKGYYDAVICFRYQALYITRYYGLKNLQSADLTLIPREYCYVSRHKEIIDAINPFLEQMENDGTIREIYGGDVITPFGWFMIPQWVYITLGVIAFVYLLLLVILQRRHHKRLEKEVERAQRSERLKTVFLGNVSHALRTPLNAVIGFSEVMIENGKDGISQEDYDNMCRLINRNGQQLLYFINELLLLSHIESSNEELELQFCDMSEAMEHCRQDFQDKMPEGVELIVEGAPGIVYLDESKLQLIMTHLLDNAVKHTHKGYIRVSHQVNKKDIYIEVEDTGEGIPESLRENIFSLLGDKSTFIQNETPGLGLSICKAAVERCKGKIGLCSTSEKGTIFWIRVPIAKHPKKNNKKI